MSEAEDEVRFKKLISVFGKNDLKEIIGILHRDQIRYHKEQTEKEVNDLKELLRDSVNVWNRITETRIYIQARTGKTAFYDLMVIMTNTIKKIEQKLKQ